MQPASQRWVEQGENLGLHGGPLTVPADQTVEGDTTGGWVAAYAGVSATDAEDDPDPTPICSPAAGEVLPLGTTTVACSVTDSGGRSDSGSFDVTVVDTTLLDIPHVNALLLSFAGRLHPQRQTRRSR